MAIIGRYKELEFLKKVLESNTPEFIAAYGRRRVGKTHLIREFFKDKSLYFELTGMKDASKSAQLKNFSTVYADTFYKGERQPPPVDWFEALNQLRYHLESIDTQKKIVVFFDELPWLASKKSGFLDALDLFWNRYISSRPNTILCICGSAAEWMIKKVVSNKGGLHNRLTRPPINLKPFNLQEAELYLKARDVHLDRKQVLELHMALGGVAYYLNLVPRGKSSSEIISELYFKEHSPLSKEFHNLFNSLYEHPQRHIELIRILSSVHQGLTQSEIFSRAKTLSPGGSAVAVLEELESCGFILRVAEYGKEKKDAKYRLVDAFTLFYLKWVENVGSVGESYWIRKQGSPTYYTWAGYAFENICFQHYNQIVKALELSVVAEVKSGWRYTNSKKSVGAGAQIDLVIDRADKCINLCEIKFYDDEITISKNYAQELKRKKSCFKEITKTRKTLFTTLISTYGAKKEANYLGAIDNQVTMDSLFH